MRNPWKRVMGNVRLSSRNGAAGGRTVTLLAQGGMSKEEIYILYPEVAHIMKTRNPIDFHLTLIRDNRAHTGGIGILLLHVSFCILFAKVRFHASIVS